MQPVVEKRHSLLTVLGEALEEAKRKTGLPEEALTVDVQLEESSSHIVEVAIRVFVDQKNYTHLL